MVSCCPVLLFAGPWPPGTQRMALLAAVLLACCFSALPVHGLGPSCVVTKGSGSPGTATTYNAVSTMTTFGEAKIVYGSNGIKVVGPISGNTTYAMVAVDVTNADGTSGFDAWAANYCTAAPNTVSNLAYNLNSDPANDIGALFEWVPLGLSTLCNQQQPRYLATAVILTTPEVSKGSNRTAP